MSELRFYIDHGMIHDRVTSKHVTTAPDDETWNGQTISHMLALLNGLSHGREEVIEECARVADGLADMAATFVQRLVTTPAKTAMMGEIGRVQSSKYSAVAQAGRDIADAIRALKPTHEG